MSREVGRRVRRGGRKREGRIKKSSAGRGRVEANGHKQEGLEEMRQGMGGGRGER